MQHVVKSHHRAVRSLNIIYQLQIAVQCNLQTSVVTKEIWVALFKVVTYKCI